MREENTDKICVVLFDYERQGNLCCLNGEGSMK